MEQQMLQMVERHSTQVRFNYKYAFCRYCLCLFHLIFFTLYPHTHFIYNFIIFQVQTLQQRIASLETPPTNSSENSMSSLAI